MKKSVIKFGLVALIAIIMLGIVSFSFKTQTVKAEESAPNTISQ